MILYVILLFLLSVLIIVCCAKKKKKNSIDTGDSRVETEAERPKRANKPKQPVEDDDGEEVAFETFRPKKVPSVVAPATAAPAPVPSSQRPPVTPTQRSSASTSAKRGSRRISRAVAAAPGDGSGGAAAGAGSLTSMMARASYAGASGKRLSTQYPGAGGGPAARGSSRGSKRHSVRRSSVHHAAAVAADVAATARSDHYQKAPVGHYSVGPPSRHSHSKSGSGSRRSVREPHHHYQPFIQQQQQQQQQLAVPMDTYTSPLPDATQLEQLYGGPLPSEQSTGVYGETPGIMLASDGGSSSGGGGGGGGSGGAYDRVLDSKRKVDVVVHEYSDNSSMMNGSGEVSVPSEASGRYGLIPLSGDQSSSKPVPLAPDSSSPYHQVSDSLLLRLERGTGTVRSMDAYNNDTDSDGDGVDMDMATLRHARITTQQQQYLLLPTGPSAVPLASVATGAAGSSNSDGGEPVYQMAGRTSTDSDYTTVPMSALREGTLRKAIESSQKLKRQEAAAASAAAANDSSSGDDGAAVTGSFLPPPPSSSKKKKGKEEK